MFGNKHMRQSVVQQSSNKREEEIEKQLKQLLPVEDWSTSMGSRQQSKDWRQKLQVSKPASSSKGTRILQSGVRIAGSMDSTKKIRSRLQPQTQKDEITWKNITFEGLSGLECRTWWEETPDTHFLKGQLHRAQVHWAVQMPLFPIKEYEGPLRGMIDTFDRFSRSSTLKYCGTEI